MQEGRHTDKTRRSDRQEHVENRNDTQKRTRAPRPPEPRAPQQQAATERKTDRQTDRRTVRQTDTLTRQYRATDKNTKSIAMTHRKKRERRDRQNLEPRNNKQRQTERQTGRQID